LRDRLIVLDADLPKRLLRELKGRGRTVQSVKHWELPDRKDPTILAYIAENHPGAVLVTGDERMPSAHEAALRRAGTTLATVDGRVPIWTNQDQWRRETVHRWAHLIVEQRPGTIRRYGETSRAWTRRRRRAASR